MSAADIDMMLSCANCGKGEEESDNLKKCSACLLVKYCSAECQKAHRPQHKKICKRRAAELYDEKLFKEIEPEDCPLCFLPFSGGHQTEFFQTCCGKTICSGCIYAMKMSESKNNSEGRRKKRDLCPYCREPPPTSNEEHIKQIHKLMDKGNGEAYYLLAMKYSLGSGLPQDYQKCNELCLKAGELGCADGYYNLACSYSNGTGVEVDKEKSKHYLELAAMGGCLVARYNLGCEEGQAGNHRRAFRHYIISAKAGYTRSLEGVKQGFMKGIVTKDEYANTLRAHHERQKEMMSDMRDKAELALEQHWGKESVIR